MMAWSRHTLIALGIAGALFSLAAGADSGALLAPTWAQRYDGGKGDDEPTAVVTDAVGDVYVTGATYGGDPANGGTGFDYATVKYSGQTGEQIWAKRYNGPNNGNDGATALCVDSTGHVYVTGQSDNGDPTNGGTSLDIVTVTYDAATGDQLQVRTFNGTGGGQDIPAGIAVDTAGNVYVAGSAYTGTINQVDYVTLKYAAPGGADWVRYYDGSGAVDTAVALGLDGGGNVFVTGYSDGGDPNLGGSGMDFATVSYSPTGDLRWARRLDDGTNGFERAVSMAIDANGDVIVLGIESPTVGPVQAQFQLVKYANGTGAPAWSQVFQNGDGTPDQPAGLAVDAAGAIYATGTRGSAPFQIIETVKYDAGGHLQWVRTYQGPSPLQNLARGAAVDAQGMVYVSGFITLGGGNQNFVVVKYNAAGDQLATYQYDSEFSGSDRPTGLALGAAGTVYVTGISENLTDEDFATVAFTTANHPPVANAGPDQTVECVSASNTGVTLDGRGSTDPDGNPLSYVWRENGTAIATGAHPTVPLALGDHTIELTVSDPDNASSTASVTVHVVDHTPPQITAPDVTLPTDADQCHATLAATAQVSDLCSTASVSGVRGDSRPLADPFDKGTTTIVWTAVDGLGNMTSTTQHVFVQDRQKPTPVCPVDRVVTQESAAGTVVTFLADGSDNCGTVTVTSQPPSGSVFAPGTTTVTTTVSDGSGNSATCTSHVTVNPPATTPGGAVSGSGTLASGVKKNRFSVNAKVKPNGKLGGNFTFQDVSGKVTVKSTSLTALVTQGTTVTLYGTAKIKKVTHSFIATFGAGKAGGSPAGSVALDLSGTAGYPSAPLATGKVVVH